MSEQGSPIDHGTLAGWWKHRRRGIPALPNTCGCSEAWADYCRAARKRSKLRHKPTGEGSKP